MSFSKDLKKYADKTNLSMEEAVISVCSQVSKSVIEKTPVDTGRAKANWIATIGTMNTKTVNTVDKSGKNSIAKANAIAKKAAGNIFYLTNNLPYIRKLEYGSYSKGPKTNNKGFSLQAPNGMVRITIQSLKAQLKRFR